MATPRKTHIFLPIIALIPSFALAQDKTDDYIPLEQSYLEELPVVLSASRLQQPELEAPGAVTVFERADIEASGARRIPELFYRVPGFQVGRFTGSEYVVAAHGFSDHYSRRMQVLVDGRSIYTPAFGGIVWESLPLHIDDIERIEIIRGPNATLYGANAFNAVISITTRFAAGTAPDSLRYVHEDRDNNSVRATLTDIGQRHELGISTFYRDDSGFGEIPGDVNKINSKTGQRPEELVDSLRTRSANGVWRLDLTPNLEITTDMGLLETVRDYGDGDSEDPYRDLTIDSHYARVKLDNTDSDGNHFSVQAFHSEVDLQDGEVFIALGDPELFDEPALGGQVDLATSFKEERSEIEFEYTPNTLGSWRFVTGGSYRNDKITGSGGRIFRDDQETVRLGRVFANSEWQSGNHWVLGAGLMIEDHEYTGESYSPKLSAIYKINAQHAVRAIASRAYRTPTAWEENGILRFFLPVPPIEDLLSDLTGSEVDFPADRLDYQAYEMEGDLKNEEITSFELGYKFVASARTKLDVRVFREDIDDMIAIYSRPFDLAEQGILSDEQIQTIEGINNFIPFDSSGLSNAIGSGNAYSTKNLVDITIDGVELDAQLELGERVQIHFGGAYLNSELDRYADSSRSITEDNMENSKETLSNSVPKYSGFLGTRLNPLPDLYFTATFFHFDEYEWHGSGDSGLGDQQFVRFYANIRKPARKHEWHAGIGGISRIDRFQDFDEANQFDNQLFAKLGVDF
ncbi:MAG: TonB-dependent receptor plug domain-containing protein [Pseudomonadota bacterium]